MVDDIRQLVCYALLPHRFHFFEHKGAICFTDTPRILRMIISFANSTSADYFLALTFATILTSRGTSE